MGQGFVEDVKIHNQCRREVRDLGKHSKEDWKCCFIKCYPINIYSF